MNFLMCFSLSVNKRAGGAEKYLQDCSWSSTCGNVTPSCWLRISIQKKICYFWSTPGCHISSLHQHFHLHVTITPLSEEICTDSHPKILYHQAFGDFSRLYPPWEDRHTAWPPGSQPFYHIRPPALSLKKQTHVHPPHYRLPFNFDISKKVSPLT